MKNKQNVSMKIVNPHCAGIDIDSNSHFVAVGQREEDIREFGVFADNLVAICDFLKAH